MQEIAGAIRELGGEIVIVSFAPPAQIAAFLLENPLPFAMVSDPERRAYQALGLGAASVGGFFRPGVVWRFLKLIFRGWMPKLPAKGADVLQLGGDFVLDRAGRVTFAHRSLDAADRPSNEVLVTEIRKAAGLVG